MAALLKPREKLIYLSNPCLILRFGCKKSAHGQILFHRHPPEHAPPFRHQCNVFAHDLRRRQCRDILPEVADLAGGRPRLPAQRAEQRGFPRTVRADQGDYFPFTHRQADFMQRLNFAVLRGDIIKFQHQYASPKYARITSGWLRIAAGVPLASGVPWFTT